MTTDELRHYAQACRVTEVMRPHLAGGRLARFTAEETRPRLPVYGG